MRVPRLARTVRSAAPGYTKNSLLELFKEYFEAVWSGVDGTEVKDLLGGSSLTLSVAPGTTYIPSTYAGTITAPDVEDYKTADANNVLYDAGGTSQALGHSDFVAADLPRIPVKYDDTAPHHIRIIALFKPAVYATLTELDKKRISNAFSLWVLYWGVYYDAGSLSKENRTWDD